MKYMRNIYTTILQLNSLAKNIARKTRTLISVVESRSFIDKTNNYLKGEIENFLNGKFLFLCYLDGGLFFFLRRKKARIIS